MRMEDLVVTIQGNVHRRKDIDIMKTCWVAVRFRCRLKRDGEMAGRLSDSGYCTVKRWA